MDTLIHGVPFQGSTADEVTRKKLYIMLLRKLLLEGIQPGHIHGYVVHIDQNWGQKQAKMPHVRFRLNNTETLRLELI